MLKLCPIAIIPKNKKCLSSYESKKYVLVIGPDKSGGP